MKKVIINILVIVMVAIVGIGGCFLWNLLQNANNKADVLEKILLKK